MIYPILSTIGMIIGFALYAVKCIQFRERIEADWLEYEAQRKIAMGWKDKLQIRDTKTGRFQRKGK